MFLINVRKILKYKVELIIEYKFKQNFIVSNEAIKLKSFSFRTISDQKKMFER